MQMQFIILLAVLLFSRNMNGQMNFSNLDADGNFPRIEIHKDDTTLFAKIGENTKPWLHWNEVPKNIESGNGRSTFKMTVYNNDGIAKIIPTLRQILRPPIYTGIKDPIRYWKNILN